MTTRKGYHKMFRDFLLQRSFLRQNNFKHTRRWNHFPWQQTGVIEDNSLRNISYWGVTQQGIFREGNWTSFIYHRATQSDVHNQCRICRGQKAFGEHKRIVQGDIVVREAKGCYFSTYHVDCAMKVLENVREMIDKAMIRKNELNEALKEQDKMEPSEHYKDPAQYKFVMECKV